MNVNSFDDNLFNKLCESTDENKNIFFSPLSISLALSMLLVGSNGTTKQQLEKALGFKKDEQLLAKYQASRNELTLDVEGIKSESAQPVFKSVSTQMKLNYKKEIKSAFNTSAVQSLNFKSKNHISKRTVNYRAATPTKRNIDYLFTDIDPETAFVFVSSNYFKGDWLHKFKSCNTYIAEFYNTQDQICKIKMMSQVNHFLYLLDEKKGFKCVNVPYKDKNFNMLVILPTEDFGVDDLLKKLDVQT